MKACHACEGVPACRARAAAPAVIFFDELDGLAANRSDAGSRQQGGTGVGERVLSQLLIEMDGLQASSSIPKSMHPAFSKHSAAAVLPEGASTLRDDGQTSTVEFERHWQDPHHTFPPNSDTCAACCLQRSQGCSDCLARSGERGYCGSGSHQ